MLSRKIIIRIVIVIVKIISIQIYNKIMIMSVKFILMLTRKILLERKLYLYNYMRKIAQTGAKVRIK